MQLTIGFSPCPNDTFIFDAMINGKIDTKGLTFKPVLEDVETLNNYATLNKLDITKLSYNAFLHTVNNYALLHAGSALGNGVGPLLVAKQKLDLVNIADYKIAIPGKNTTANLLLSLAFPKATNKHELVFSEIESAVLKGEFDAGLIIHESRFTYAQKGLNKLIDLGDWWEQETNAAIPLGGIVIKRTLGKVIAAKVDEVIKASIEYAWQNHPNLSTYVSDHAQEMEEDVMRQHIDLYVNDYTTNLGSVGTSAVKQLFSLAKEKGLIKTLPENIFY
ncbi:MAG: 1,4-dihydroxy-6-naphthoate synthase [Flavipsychrobacter sp.]